MPVPNAQLRVRYADMVMERLRADLIFVPGRTCSNRYEGDPTAGAVKVPVRPEVAAKEYNISTGGVLNDAETTYVSILLDEDLYINELCDGYKAAAVSDDMYAERLDSGTYSLAYAMQLRAIEELAKTTTIATSTDAVTADTIYAEILKARTTLSKNKVKKRNRILLITPDAYSLLQQDTHFIVGGNTSQEILMSGYVGYVAGFEVYECPDLPEDCDFIAYQIDWLQEIFEWRVFPEVVDIKDGKHIGSSAVQGRTVATYKLTEPKACYKKTNQPA